MWQPLEVKITYHSWHSAWVAVTELRHRTAHPTKHPQVCNPTDVSTSTTNTSTSTTTTLHSHRNSWWQACGHSPGSARATCLQDGCPAPCEMLFAGRIHAMLHSHCHCRSWRAACPAAHTELRMCQQKHLKCVKRDAPNDAAGMMTADGLCGLPGTTPVVQDTKTHRQRLTELTTTSCTPSPFSTKAANAV